MENNIQIKKIGKEDLAAAVEILTEGFVDDPLHLNLFPEIKERERVTRCIYEMMVYDIVPGLNLQLNGLYFKNQIAGCLIYTTPDSNEWHEGMMEAVTEMITKADSPNIKYIGEYAMKTSALKPKETHFYLNELSVRKQFRRKGIARMLIDSAEKDAINFPEVKIIGLDTTNYLNVEIYKKIGYNVFHEFNFMDLTGNIMIKEVQPKEF